MFVLTLLYLSNLYDFQHPNFYFDKELYRGRVSFSFKTGDGPISGFVPTPRPGSRDFRLRLYLLSDISSRES